MTEHAVVKPEEASAATTMAAATATSPAVAAATTTTTSSMDAEQAEAPARSTPAPAEEAEAAVMPPSALDTSVAGSTTSGVDTSCSGGSGEVGGWKVGPEDFTLLCVIGQGAFGRVLQVRSKFDQEVYAMKVISKRMLKKKNHLSYMRAERDIMTKVDFPFIVGLKFSFQTEEKLFLVMNYLPGGELFFHLRKQGLILEDTARFYGAELVLALEHLHSKGIIHRDLKPENVLVDRHGHLCLTDFGLAKDLNSTSGSSASPSTASTGEGGSGGEGDEDEEGGRTRTVCGTNEYMCPEMILKKGYGKAADWWSLGALMYEMMAGHAPFRAKAVKELNRKILHEKLSLPKWLTSDAHAVLKGLLERNVQKRLGAARSTMFELGGVAALKAHRFFAKIDWQKLLRKQLPAPVVPELSDEVDTRNFDEEFTKMDLSLSLVEVEDAEATHSDTFTGFSFIESSVPLPQHEPDYKKQLRKDREARRLLGHADPDLFDGVGGGTPAGSAKKKKKKKPAAAAAAATAAAAAATTAATAEQQPAEEHGPPVRGGGVTGAGASPVAGEAAGAAAAMDGDETKARSTSIAESGVDGEDGVDKTLRLLQAAAAAGAAARKLQQEEGEGEEGASAPPSALAADFPPLVAAGETQAAFSRSSSTASASAAPSSAWASPARKGGQPAPMQGGALAEPLRREQAPTPPIKQEQQPAPTPAPTALAPAAPKPAFSWSAVVAKHGTPATASAPASPFKAPVPVKAASALPAFPSKATAGQQGPQQPQQQEEDEDDGFVTVTSKRKQPRGAPAPAPAPAPASSLNASAKAFVPSWASRV